MADPGYVLRLEASCESLRKRNGELAAALAAADPDHPFAGKPLGDSRATTLVRLADTAIELAHDRATIEELREAVAKYQNYWENDLERRSKESEKATARWEARRASGAEQD